MTPINGVKRSYVNGETSAGRNRRNSGGALGWFPNETAAELTAQRTLRGRMVATARFPLIIVCLATLTVACDAPAFAEIQLARVLGSHMVVQQGRPIRIWGGAAAGEAVTVTLADENKSATADAAGRWLVELAARPRNDQAHTDPLTISIAGSSSKAPIKLEDVLVGDVWLCAGQSNMGTCVRDANGGQETLAAIDLPQMRLFDRVPYLTAAKPQNDLIAGSWRDCSRDNAAIFSAVGFYFGRKVHEKTGVPIGLVSCAFGGTAIEAWISRQTLEEIPTAGPLLKRYQDSLPGYDARYAAYRKLFDAVVIARDQARARGEEWWKIPEPGQPFGPHHRYAPFCIYNAMIHPLENLSLRGVIWYQGESSADRGELHRDLLPGLVRDWRNHFRDERMPFGIVQLPNINPRKPDPGESEWAELREAQFLTARRGTQIGLAITIDIGDVKDLHPGNKKDVGERLALWALSSVYGQPIAPCGPFYDGFAVEGNAIRVRFDHCAAGLGAKGEEPLAGFAIAGSDRKFVWAEARIDGKSVVVRNAAVPAPVAVRYGWADNPACNLANSAGLLASPFRTDDWPVITTGRR